MDPAAWRGPWVLTGCGEDLCPQQFGDICGLRTGGLQESEPDTHTQAGVSPGMARTGPGMPRERWHRVLPTWGGCQHPER